MSSQSHTHKKQIHNNLYTETILDIAPAIAGACLLAVFLIMGLS